ncbi:MAG: hypothetical protein HY908_15280 [Myxococcales bacterium]|nr:hypothetical protein [Myxococcales bacterium]
MMSRVLLSALAVSFAHCAANSVALAADNALATVEVDESLDVTVKLPDDCKLQPSTYGPVRIGSYAKEMFEIRRIDAGEAECADGRPLRIDWPNMTRRSRTITASVRAVSPNHSWIFGDTIGRKVWRELKGFDAKCKYKVADDCKIVDDGDAQRLKLPEDGDRAPEGGVEFTLPGGEVVKVVVSSCQYELASPEMIVSGALTQLITVAVTDRRQECIEALGSVKSVRLPGADVPTTVQRRGDYFALLELHDIPAQLAAAHTDAQLTTPNGPAGAVAILIGSSLKTQPKGEVRYDVDAIRKLAGESGKQLATHFEHASGEASTDRVNDAELPIAVVDPVDDDGGAYVFNVVNVDVPSSLAAWPVYSAADDAPPDERTYPFTGFYAARRS